MLVPSLTQAARSRLCSGRDLRHKNIVRRPVTTGEYNSSLCPNAQQHERVKLDPRSREADLNEWLRSAIEFVASDHNSFD